MRRRLYIVFLFISAYGFAQSPFYAQISKNRVAVGEVFQISFTIEGNGNNLAFPNLKNFDLYSGPNQTQNMTMINGNFSQSTTISLALAAKKEGKYTIGPATVMMGNQRLETKPIVIDVVKGNSPQQGGTAQQGQQQPNQYASAIGNEDLFVRTYLSKTKCYLGEQVVLTQKIYSKVDLRGFQNVKFPPYNGFWSHQEDYNKQINLEKENVNGVMYYVADYNKVFLFPQRTGTINVDPIEVDCIVRRTVNRAPRDIFEQFFGTGRYEDVIVKVKSKPVKIEVVDLPSENKPDGFTGAVGNFSYHAELNKQEVKANEAVNLRITVSGKGNIKLLDPLQFKLPESFEVYDPKISESIKVNGTVSGSKTFDYIIIPREKGDYTLDNLNFSYFDTEKKHYVTLPSPDIKLKVLEGDNSSAQIMSPTKKGIKEGENDLRYIKKGDLALKKNTVEFFSSTTHYTLLVIPFILFLAALFFVRQHMKANSNLQEVRERKAAKMAKKQLILAERYMKSNQKDPFFTEVLNALNRYIGHKFALPVADLSKEKISEMLLLRHVNEETILKVVDTLHTCEYARYSPDMVTGDLKRVYDDTVELISRIEEQFKK